MARPEQDTIETFISITGASESVALQKLEEHGGDLNEAVNAYFNEGERIIAQPDSADPENHFMDVDDPVENEPRQSLFSGSSLHPFSLLDPAFVTDLFDRRGPPDTRGRRPLVSHPREVREIPTEYKGGDGQSYKSRTRPTIEDISSSADLYGPGKYGNVTIVEDGDAVQVQASAAQGQNREANGSLRDASVDRFPEPSAPLLIDDHNEIEEEMLQAAIEASKRDANSVAQSGLYDDGDGPSHQAPPVTEDPDLACAVSLSLKTAEQEKALRELRAMNGVGQAELLDFGVGASTVNGSSSRGSSSGINVEARYSFIPGENDEVEDAPLVRTRSKLFPSWSVDTSSESNQQREAPSSTTEPNPAASQGNEDHFRSDEMWGGISSEEHDEAVMLEAALFGGIPEGVSYRYAYPPDHGAQTTSNSLYSRPSPRPPSPTLTAQRLLREQQDDVYLISLLAHQEKEEKAKQEAEIHLLEEVAAREAAIQREKLQEEESCLKLLEEQRLERELAVKEASLPREPESDDENAVTLLIRMPEGKRCGRRFLKSNMLRSLFDFIDVGRVVKPGTYRLVRPYPRCAFSDAEKELSLGELGLTSKQEALFLEYL